MCLLSYKWRELIGNITVNKSYIENYFTLKLYIKNAHLTVAVIHTNTHAYTYILLYGFIDTGIDKIMQIYSVGVWRLWVWTICIQNIWSISFKSMGVLDVWLSLYIPFQVYIRVHAKRTQCNNCYILDVWL